MSGLEKITEHIIDNAKRQSEINISNAKNQAAEISAKTKEITEELTKKNQQLINDECDRIIQMAQASDRQTKRQILLKAKSDVIKSIIDEAKETLINMDKSEYLSSLKTILKNSVGDESGEILFGSKDKELIDDDFIEYIIKISGGKLKYSDEDSKIEHGFIIKYGNIEHNCSIDGLFEDKYNELCDLVNSCLMTN